VLLSEEEWERSQARAEDEKRSAESYYGARAISPLNIMYYDHWVSSMLHEIPKGCKGPLVELMCGRAEISRRLPPRFQTALAMDWNTCVVEQAARDLARVGEKRVTVVCGTVRRLPLPDETAGVVMVQGGLHHVRAFLSEVLAEVARVLRPHGVLIAAEPANDHWLTRRIRHWQYSRSRALGNDPDEGGFTEPELREALAQHGLRLERYRFSGFVAYPLMGNTDLVPLLARIRSRALGRALLALDWFLEHIPFLRRMAWTSIFRAIKDLSQ
jgi:ubiquinone/menaquinone biosynthesis C-methylase UbiE